MATVLIAPLAAVVMLAAAWAVLALQRRSQRRLVGIAVRGTVVSGAERLDILYFTGENCTVCHVAQRPALGRLRSLIGDVVIREIDVARDPAAARRYRVMTLPTTVVLDPGGRTVAVNAGYASETALHEQVRKARGSMAGAFA